MHDRLANICSPCRIAGVMKMSPTKLPVYHVDSQPAHRARFAHSARKKVGFMPMP